MTAVLAGVCAAAGAALLRAVAGSVTNRGELPTAQTSQTPAERPLLIRLRLGLCCLAVAAGWVVLGGLLGVGVGLIGATLSWRALERLEHPAAARRRQELERDLPAAVHLLAACLAAGAATGSALESVAESMPGAVADELRLLRRRLHWGVDPLTVWRSVEGPLKPLGRTMARAHESGASVQHAVTRLAADLRNETRMRADTKARTIEVRAAAPLGLCFLPAFVLLGVVPMVSALFTSLAIFR